MKLLLDSRNEQLLFFQDRIEILESINLSQNRINNTEVPSGIMLNLPNGDEIQWKDIVNSHQCWLLIIDEEDLTNIVERSFCENYHRNNDVLKMAIVILSSKSNIDCKTIENSGIPYYTTRQKGEFIKYCKDPYFLFLQGTKTESFIPHSIKNLEEYLINFNFKN